MNLTKEPDGSPQQRYQLGMKALENGITGGRGQSYFYLKETEFAGEVFYQSNEQAWFSRNWGLVWILNDHQINKGRKHKCSEILRLEACFLWLSCSLHF